jgi:hyperosmotically inducible protein
MNMKPALLVATLVAAVAVTAGCEQRGANDTVGKRMDQAPGKMEAQTTPPGQTADKLAAQTGQAADKLASVADDSAITAKVKAAILAEPGLKSLQIDVDTKNATVTLSGNVASDNLRDRAKQIAMSTEGVRNVVDNLSVRTS